MSLDENSPPVRMALHLQKRLTSGERLQKYEGGEFLYRFLCALLRETEHPVTQKKSSSVQKAAEIMEEEYRRLGGIEELAARLDISPGTSLKGIQGRDGDNTSGLSYRASPAVSYE